MENTIQFRMANSDDFDFLKKMLYEAVYWRSIKIGKAPIFDEALKADDLLNSLIDWGKRKMDLGVISFYGNEKIGAAWLRQYQKSNAIRGFINELIPVLVIGIKSDFRNQGIGTGVLRLLFEKAKVKGIKKISLMVSEDNEAFHLYKKVGFELKSKIDDSLLMIKYI